MIVMKRILVAVNFEEHDNVPSKWAGTVATYSGAEVRIVYVAEPCGFGEEDMEEHLSHCRVAMDAEVERLSGFDVSVKGEVLPDTGYGAAGTILNLARDWDADLIVLGSHPRKGLARLLSGSIASRIIEGAPCSVLLAKAVA